MATSWKKPDTGIMASTGRILPPPTKYNSTTPSCELFTDATMLTTPMSSPVYASLVLSVSVLIWAAVRWLLSTRRPKNYPPGPPTLLGLGNLHQIPRLWHHLKLDDWAKQYGPITGLKLGPLNVIVLNDAALVHQLFVKRAAAFNDRYTPYIAKHHILPEGQLSYSLFMNNDYNSRLRTMTKQTVVGSGLSNMAPLQKAGATKLLWKLFEGGQDWVEHLKPW